MELITINCVRDIPQKWFQNKYKIGTGSDSHHSELHFLWKFNVSTMKRIFTPSLSLACRLNSEVLQFISAFIKIYLTSIKSHKSRDVGISLSFARKISNRKLMCTEWGNIADIDLRQTTNKMRVNILMRLEREESILVVFRHSITLVSIGRLAKRIDEIFVVSDDDQLKILQIRSTLDDSKQRFASWTSLVRD